MSDRAREPESCPCGSGLLYTQCCGPCLAGEQLPASAEALMRSRYTAFVLREDTYLYETWHSSSRPPASSLKLAPEVKWLGLKILGKQAGGRNDVTGQVEFVARYKIAGKAHKLHEQSRFVRENGHWYYLDGKSQDE